MTRLPNPLIAQGKGRSERKPPPRNGTPPRPGEGGRLEGRLAIEQLFLEGV